MSMEDVLHEVAAASSELLRQVLQSTLPEALSSSSSPNDYPSWRRLHHRPSASRTIGTDPPVARRDDDGGSRERRLRGRGSHRRSVDIDAGGGVIGIAGGRAAASASVAHGAASQNRSSSSAGVGEVARLDRGLRRGRRYGERDIATGPETSKYSSIYSQDDDEDDEDGDAGDDGDDKYDDTNRTTRDHITSTNRRI